MAKLQAVEDLRVAAGRFHDLQHGFVRDAEKWPLSQKGIVLDVVAADEIPDQSWRLLKKVRGAAGQLAKLSQENVFVGNRRRQILQRHQHRTEGAGHHRAFLGGGFENNRKSTGLRQRLVAIAGDGNRADAALPLKIFGGLDNLRRLAGARNEHRNRRTAFAQRHVGKEHNLRSGYRSRCHARDRRKHSRRR